MMDQVSKVDAALRAAEKAGTWAEYAVEVMGEPDTGDPEFDDAVMGLYIANEEMHRTANKLALRYELELYEAPDGKFS
jgi:hypothetical protein